LTSKSKRNLIREAFWQEALVNELSSYVFSPLREGDIAVHRGSGSGLASMTSSGRRDGLRCQISAENADRLFNAFFTTKSSGMGMGLSICRSIMEAHGGRLWATANLPHGATFQFTLPVNAEHAP
jgi:light-regulated signal transduction histidine kinase (bacteriophytochrome)